MFAALFEFISLCIIVGLPIIFLILLILLRKRKNPLIAGIFLLLFIASSGYATYYFMSIQKYKTETKEKYLGFYKLDKLDCEECVDCKVELHPDYSYNIYKDNKVVGKGKWELVWDPESGYFLRIDNGSGAMSFETPKEIEYISRKDCR